MQTDSSKENLCSNCGNPKQKCATLLLHFTGVQEVEWYNGVKRKQIVILVLVTIGLC